MQGTGSNLCVSGRIETGSISVGDRVLVCPTRESATVKALAIEDSSQQVVFAGDQASVTLTGIDMQNVAVGYILCDPQYPVPSASKFQARIVVFNVKVPITKGYPVSKNLFFFNFITTNLQNLQQDCLNCELVFILLNLNLKTAN